ncbi:MAG: hypothetical protein Q9214_001925 [Letrouitia sp. 1 TL-2023]
MAPSGGLKQQISLNASNSGPAIPWRRANVRHTSNELYVDIVETLRVILAPSGRPMAAFANGSIAFTSKISGVPDLLLTLSSSGGKLGLEKAIELPVFHPCVRLARWNERPGELSFVPPDGKFVLAGYEVDLMPSISDFKSWSNTKLQLPATIEVWKSLGPTGSDFEIRLIISNVFPGYSSSSLGPRQALSSRGSGRSTPTLMFGSGTSSSPTLHELSVTVLIPSSACDVADLRASRGEAYFVTNDSTVEWRIPTKEAALPGIATLKCTVIGEPLDDDGGMVNGFQPSSKINEYEEGDATYQSTIPEFAKPTAKKEQRETQDLQRVQQNAHLMPSSASLSFSVKGWLASGIKVDGLTVDTRKSKGLGEGVKPYKGVKYLTASKKGIETRSSLTYNEPPRAVSLPRLGRSLDSEFPPNRECVEIAQILLLLLDQPPRSCHTYLLISPLPASLGIAQESKILYNLVMCNCKRQRPIDMLERISVSYRITEARFWAHIAGFHSPGEAPLYR